MSSGVLKHWSLGSITAWNGLAVLAMPARALYPSSFPARAQERRHSCTSQRPTMLRSRRTVPATPPSLVKPSVRTRSLIAGRGETAPMSDQVPELM